MIASTTLHPRQVAVAPWTRQLRGHLAHAARAFYAGFREQQALRALRALDDRTLADLGLRRETLPHAVRDAVPW